MANAQSRASQTYRFERAPDVSARLGSALGNLGGRRKSARRVMKKSPDTLRPEKRVFVVRGRGRRATASENTPGRTRWGVTWTRPASARNASAATDAASLQTRGPRGTTCVPICTASLGKSCGTWRGPCRPRTSWGTRIRNDTRPRRGQAKEVTRRATRRRRRARRGDPLPTRACSRTKTRSACWKIRRRGWTLSTRTLHMCWIGSKANAEATSSAFTSARSWSTACVSILQSERKRSPCIGRWRSRWAPAVWSDSSSSCSGRAASAGRRKSRTGSIT